MAGKIVSLIPGSTRSDHPSGDHEATESLLRMSEERYRRIVDTITDYIFTVYIENGQPTMTKHRPACEGVTGYSSEEFETDPYLWIKMVPEEDHCRINKQIASILSKKKPYSIEHRIIRKDGEVRWVANIPVPHEDDLGNLVSYDGLIRDITERKLAEKQLRQAKEEWERTFNAIQDIITIMDLQMRIIQVNRTACEMLQSEPEEIIGRYCYEVFRKSPSTCSHCPAEATLRDLKTHSHEIEHEYLQRSFLVSCSPLFDEQGAFKGIVHTAKDISVQKKLSQQLHKAQKMEAIGTLAGGIAHDFNNLLAAILGFAQMAKDEAMTDSPVSRYLGNVLQAGKRATELVKQILAFSRQDRQKNDIMPFQVSSIIKESIKLLRASLPATIDIKRHIDPQCGLIVADPNQVQQVFMNLCTNAFHAMEETGGRLDITLKLADQDKSDFCRKQDDNTTQYIELVVRDSGPGIDPAIQQKIFHPYFTTKEAGKGTGLGLSIVHGIVTNLGGQIFVESELGKGAAFFVYFPMCESTAIPEKHLLAEQNPRGNEHILFVDDEDLLVEMNKDMLEGLGYTVTGKTCSCEALLKFQHQPNLFDLVITDQTMPGMTGTLLARSLLQIRPDIPIILCTGFSNIISEEQAKEIGIKEFVMKPLLQGDISMLIRKVLDSGTPQPLVGRQELNHGQGDGS